MKHLLASLLAVLMLAASGRANVEALIADLKSNDPDVRRTAARQLGERGVEARPGLDALVKALKDEDVFVRKFSALALGGIGGEVKGVVPALAGALKDRDKRVVQAAAEALGKTGTAGVKPLTEVVKNKSLDHNTRLKAVQALGQVGKGAKEAVPALVDVVKDGGRRNDPNVLTLRTEAVNALGNMGPAAEEAVKTLEEIVADRMVRDRNFKQAAQQALRKIKK
jgi:HEAT repeat protein